MNLARLWKRLKPQVLVVHHLERDVARLTESTNWLERELAGELAENDRLVAELADALRQLAAARAASQPCICANMAGAVAFWQRQSAQDRRNLVRLEDRLAVHEGRAPVGGVA